MVASWVIPILDEVLARALEETTADMQFLTGAQDAHFVITNAEYGVFTQDIPKIRLSKYFFKNRLRNEAAILSALYTRPSKLKKAGFKWFCDEVVKGGLDAIG